MTGLAVPSGVSVSAPGAPATLLLLFADVLVTYAQQDYERLRDYKQRKLRELTCMSVTCDFVCGMAGIMETGKM